MKKIPFSPLLHNFNVRVPECGSLGTRLSLMFPQNASVAITLEDFGFKLVTENLYLTTAFKTNALETSE